ncbi:hypothetical protein M436DRAFT_82945 [Aureobasidium namibiae CBS 147.97]|uniref:Uncharacterized protein n=1 Tax=Aureobasidium namibiae CBS 147.97 TaxID=1043004 RepID=A0A074WG25_9PEZI
MDKDTAKEIQNAQDQSTPRSTRKRKREDVDLEDGIKSPKEFLTPSNKKRLKATPKSVQKCKKCSALSKKNDQLQEELKQLEVEKKQLEDATMEHKTSLRKLYDVYDKMEQENEVLKTKLKKLEK